MAHLFQFGRVAHLFLPSLGFGFSGLLLLWGQRALRAGEDSFIEIQKSFFVAHQLAPQCAVLFDLRIEPHALRQ